MVNIKELSLSELFILYQFVCARPLNNNEYARKIIKARIEEIEEELYKRAFGENPYRHRSH